MQFRCNPKLRSHIAVASRGRGCWSLIPDRSARPTEAEVLAERADPNLASFPATPAPVQIDILDDLTDQHAEVLATTAANLDQMKAATARNVTEVTEGPRLETSYPWCRGEQLMVRSIGADWSPEVVIRCESGICEPTPGECGTWHRGMPCWPLNERKWLAQHMG
ncbi:hypothetical protein [Nesterenkonia sp. CF4.4]|uniref:hypothetical protein n=1 Tax=Nesterenkonia sp. CF4.4 TaxID=3373079 RepID=UPI003EE7B6E1